MENTPHHYDINRTTHSKLRGFIIQMLCIFVFPPKYAETALQKYNEALH